MLIFFRRGENRSTRRKPLGAQQRTHNKLNPHMTRATLVGGECSHHCANPAPHKSYMEAQILTTEVLLLSILTIQLLVVVCLTFEIFTKILGFFNMWVFVRTSTNFAHLWLAFRAIEFMDRSVLKMLDINFYWYVRLVKTKLSLQNAAFCNCCSRKKRTRFKFIPSLHAFYQKCLSYDRAMKCVICASFLHLHMSAELFTTQNVGRNCSSSENPSLGNQA